MRSFRSEAGGGSLKFFAQIASNSALFMAGRPAIWSESAVFMGLLRPLFSTQRTDPHTVTLCLGGQSSRLLEQDSDTVRPPLPRPRGQGALVLSIDAGSRSTAAPEHPCYKRLTILQGCNRLKAGDRT